MNRKGLLILWAALSLYTSLKNTSTDTGFFVFYFVVNNTNNPDGINALLVATIA